MRIFEQPIPTYYGDEICHVNGMFYAMHCVLTTLKFYLNRRRGQFTYPGPMDVPRLASSADKIK